jgi:hypothetical protein
MKYKIIVDTKGHIITQNGSSKIEIIKKFCSEKAAKKHVKETYLGLLEFLFPHYDFHIVKE